MSSEPPSPEPPWTETAATRASNPIDTGVAERPRRRGIDDGPVSGTRTRVVSLRSELELLAAEREFLRNRVVALEADVAELEDEVAALEGSLETEERRRQRVIDRYEELVAEREATNRELRSAAETEGTGNRRVRPLHAITSSVRTVWNRLQRLVPNG